MNEEKMQNAMKTYGESLGECRRRPAVRVSRRSRPIAALAVGCVLVLSVAVSLWPKDAVAGTLNKVSQALKNVRTMEVVRMMETSPGKWHTFHHLYYQDGVWAHTNRKGSGVENHVIVRDGWALTKYRRLNHATLEEADPYFHELFKGDMPAIDYTKMIIDQGSVGIERTTKIEPHANVDGRPTYKIVMERAEGEYRAEIIVDQLSDLPRSVTTTLRHSSPGRTLRYQDEFRFNHALPEAVFQLDPKIPVLRLPDEQRRLEEKWSKSLGEVDGAIVRDATITSDGTIWVACTTTFMQDACSLPTRVISKDGQAYTRTIDVVPSSMLGKTKVDAFRGQRIVMVAFVPLSTSQPRPAEVNLVFSRRKQRHLGSNEPDEASEAEGKVLSLKLHNEPNRDRPDYFTALDMDYSGLQLPITIWEARAKALEKAGRTLEAAKAYEQTAVAYRGFIKYVGYAPLLEAARCYRELGMVREAEDREKEAEALRQNRNR